MAKAKPTTITSISFLEQLAQVVKINTKQVVDLERMKVAFAKDDVEFSPALSTLVQSLYIRRLSMAEVERLMEIYYQREFIPQTEGKKPMWIDRTIEYTDTILHMCIVDMNGEPIFAPHAIPPHSGHGSQSLPYHACKDIVDQCERLNNMYDYAKKDLVAAVGESSDPKNSDAT